MKHTPEEIIEALNIEEKVIAIYPYGSQVYGTASKWSDHDYIIVAMPSMLISGGQKENARSSDDGLIQGTLYSRGGFQDAINNYMLPAMECLSLESGQVLLSKMNFKMGKYVEKDMIKSVVKQASASRHTATKQSKTGSKELRGDLKYRAARGMFQSLRILHFGLQLKEHQKIINFSECNELYHSMIPSPEVIDIDEFEFDTRDYYDMFDEIKSKLEG